MDNPNDVTYFAETDSRNKRIKFGIKREDRSKHMYVIGKTGMGKSTLLESLAIQDIQNGEGIAFMDPHGKTAELLLEYIPKERMKDVIYFAPFDLEHPVAFNVMEDVGPERRHLVASGLMSAFKKIWVDAWSARMEYILGNIMLALLEYPGSTLIGVNRMLADKDYRKKVVDNITDPSVRSFWVDEYAKYTDKFAAEAAPAIQNKVGQFVANPLVRNIIGQAKSSFDIRKVMDEKKILIINLSKGRVGEANANLLGSMIITKIYLAAMSRADLSQTELKKAPNFYLYVDEFQSFANESFADILSEARKYKLNLTIAHQYIEQMAEEVRAAVFGNVGSMITYRVGAYDAEVLEKEYAPQFTAEDLVNLQQYQMYLKLMIDGVTSMPFSATGMTPIPPPAQTYVREIIDSSRKLYAHPRSVVEDEIRRWHEDKSTGSASAPTGGPRSDAPRYDAPRPQQAGYSNTAPRQAAPSYNRAPATSYNQPPRQERQETRLPSRAPAQQPSRQSEPRPEPHSEYRSEPRNDRPVQPRAEAPRPQSQSVPQAPRERTAAESVAARPSPTDPKYSPVNQSREQLRETEFRKAISLSYLKNESEPKNDQKTAKPENVAALREALLSVMKDVQLGGEAQQSESVSTTVAAPQQQSQQRPQREPIRNSALHPKKEHPTAVASTVVHAQKVTSHPRPAVKAIAVSKTVSTSTSTITHHHHSHIKTHADAPKAEPKAEQKKEAPVAPAPAHEVPADILKQLLDVKE